MPEVQDVWVREDVRRRGVATRLAHAAQRGAAERGHARISLSHGISNEAARQLYEGLGYRNAGLEPEVVKGVVRMSSGPVEVDDTLIYLIKELPVDSAASRSS